MPSRAYVAHDRAVSAARMYVQMAVVGFLLASVLYAGVMAAFLSRYVAGPVPELRFVGGKPRLNVNARSPRLPVVSLLKYYVSLNPKNYLRIRLSSKRLGAQEKREAVEPVLQPFFRQREVPRETYRKGIRWITRGRVEQLRWVFPVSLLFFPLFGLVYFVAFSLLNRRLSKTRFVRGADLVPFSQMKAALDKAIEEEEAANPMLVPLSLGKLALPDSVSRRHVLVLGTTGAGKSICLNNYLRTLKARRAYPDEVSKCVVYDTKGEFCAKHFEQGDLIYYPFDRRSTPWSFFNEVRDYPDLDVLSTSLYEPPKDCKDPYWYKAARDIFRTGLFHLLREDRTGNRDIWEFFSQPLHYIKDALYTLPVRELGALKHIDKVDSNQAASIISILQERLTFFRYLTDSDGPFSFRSFIQNEGDRRNLYLMNKQQYEAIFRPLMTFVIDIMTREVLSLEDSFSRRITFVVDEFGSLDKMPCIFNFLTMGRSNVGFLVLANQDLDSVSTNYGLTRMKTPRKFLPKVNKEFDPRDFGLKKMLQERPGPPVSGQTTQPVQFTP